VLDGKSVKRFMNCKRLTNHIDNFLESVTVISRIPYAESKD
jgi:hypothetical protein